MPSYVAMTVSAVAAPISGVAGEREPGDDLGYIRRAAAGVVAGGRAVILGGDLHVRAAWQAGHLEGRRAGT